MDIIIVFYLRSDSSSTEINGKTPPVTVSGGFTSTAVAERALIHFSSQFHLDRRFVIPAIIFLQRQGAHMIKEEQVSPQGEKNPITQKISQQSFYKAIIMQSSGSQYCTVSNSLPEYRKLYLCSGCVLNTAGFVYNHVIDSLAFKSVHQFQPCIWVASLEKIIVIYRLFQTCV